MFFFFVFDKWMHSCRFQTSLDATTAWIRNHIQRSSFATRRTHTHLVADGFIGEMLCYTWKTCWMPITCSLLGDQLYFVGKWRTSNAWNWNRYTQDTHEISKTNECIEWANGEENVVAYYVAIFAVAWAYICVWKINRDDKQMTMG